MAAALLSFDLPENVDPLEDRSAKQGALRSPLGFTPATHAAWSFDELRGRLVELTADGAGATMTSAFDIILDAQEAGEPAAWISATPTLFSPVDVEASGVDLSALAVIRLRNVFSATRSAERLLRSGAFGVLVLDLGPNPQVPAAMLGKLVKLSQLHDATVICLTTSRRGRDSLGSMISLRAGSHRERAADGAFSCRLDVTKDKRRGPNWSFEQAYRGPTGLR